MRHLAVTPPTIAQRQSAVGLIQPEQVEVIRHEPFDYAFQGSRHLLIATERAERDDGETILDGLPRNTPIIAAALMRDCGGSRSGFHRCICETRQ